MVTIDRVECTAIEVPLRTAFAGGTYNVTKRCTIVTRIYASDGAVGQVYNGDPRDNAGQIIDLISNEMTALVVGEDPDNVGHIWDKLFRLTLPHGDRDTLMQAIACVDCAIWDLRAKRLGTNVATLLGRTPRPLPVIAIAGYYGEGKGTRELMEEMVGLREAGLAGCKMKVGRLSPEEDARRVEAARSAAGDNFVLAVDANQAWTVREALRFAVAISDLDIEWFEEPCHWYADWEDMARVARKLTMPICAGQSERTSHGALRLLANESVEVINYDASEGGGVTEWRRVAAFCDTYGRRVAHHEEPQISNQLLSTVAHPAFVECFPDPDRDPIWSSMLTEGPRIENGMTVPPTGDGFGLEFDESFVQKYSIR